MSNVDIITNRERSGPGAGVRLENHFALVLRLLLGGLFLYAGFIKILSPADLLQDIEGYRLLPYSLAWIAALYLAPLEVLAGVALWLPRWYRAGALLLSALMIVFLLAILSAWIRGLDITCGCFGRSENSEPASYAWLIVRDIALFLGLFYLYRRKTKVKL